MTSSSTAGMASLRLPSVADEQRKKGRTTMRANYCFPQESLWEEKVIRRINGNSPYSISFMKRMIRETDG